MKKGILNAEQKFNIGGQAVIEGVMFRGKNFWSVAVRREDGSIKSDVFPLNLRYQKSRISKLPFFRGVFILLDSLYLGYKALEYSAANAFDEDVKIEGKEFGFAGFLAALIAVVLFVLIPLFATKYLVGVQANKNSFLFSLVEGLIRLSIFIFYLFGVSLLKDIQRVFAYHGAEHMVIHAFEHEGVVDPKRASRYSPLHLSCGTSFIVFVLLIMIVLHAFIKGPFLVAFAIRLLLIPLVAGISYEFVRFARRHEESLLVKILSFPGLLVQKLTTRKPDLSQLEVASHSLKVLLDSENISYKATSL
ncbi:MAG: DUF1385 domain-containing protein [Actinobacteria bacterium]|nr:DUF1385 domain-containing protein [Actinomycetota bacterium]